MGLLKKLLLVQALLIAGGTVFAWSKLIPQFQVFYAEYGTLFKFEGCVIPNPIATPCFWGSVAFVVALLWSLSLLINEFSARSQWWLRNLLAFGVIFAATVVTFEFLQYYKVIGGPVISCSPGVFPLKTPCFTGLIFFLLSFVTSIFVVKQSRKTSV